MWAGGRGQAYHAEFAALAEFGDGVAAADGALFVGSRQWIVEVVGEGGEYEGDGHSSWRSSNSLCLAVSEQGGDVVGWRLSGWEVAREVVKL